MRKALALAVVVAAAAGAAEKWPESAELIIKGLKFTEGPAWSAKGFLLFSDIPANRIYRWEEGKEPVAFRDPSNNSNGLAFDAQGRLIACEHGARRVTRTEADGTVTVLADQFEGKRLNSPNDLTLAADGSIYFTDPPYGVKREDRELDFEGVYRLSPDGKLALVVKDLGRPNGIGLSPDGKRLYVDDSEARTVHVYDVQADGTVANGRLLINLGLHGTRVCDGLKVDAEGNLYVTGTDAVYVVSPDGKLLAKIACPGQCTNCCFGGPDGKTLFVTARTKEGGGVYRVRVPIAGSSPK
ncbi:MAG TPA: SMP-30/gluconolactonase/LRE family protein [Planctomycetota bacterium]|nr:SMP-30/gluconolactonase/LRE family protein [Planctomycetota bacterium]HRR82590.1 SMP-30/gluconolactonase/LRE family protein [Planctomycetota bacterium]HRT95056.1 SMP-30/gluconolactonase/LRE family protein [Planctomycetota bacterium]